MQRFPPPPQFISKSKTKRWHGSSCPSLHLSQHPSTCVTVGVVQARCLLREQGIHAVPCPSQRQWHEACCFTHPSMGQGACRCSSLLWVPGDPESLLDSSGREVGTCVAGNLQARQPRGPEGLSFCFRLRRLSLWGHRSVQRGLSSSRSWHCGKDSGPGPPSAPPACKVHCQKPATAFHF